MFVPIRDAAIIAQTNPAHLRQRAHRLQLTACCDMKTRRVLYSLPDLIELERATRQKQSQAAA